MYFNCFSINNQLVELKLFLKNHAVDIALLTETFLKPNHKLTINGYHIICRHQPIGHGGGTAILINKSLDFHEIIIPDTETFGATCGVKIIVDDTTFCCYVLMYKAIKSK